MNREPQAKRVWTLVLRPLLRMGNGYGRTNSANVEGSHWLSVRCLGDSLSTV